MLDELIDASDEGRLARLAELHNQNPDLAQRVERLLARALGDSDLEKGLEGVAPDLLGALAEQSDKEDQARIGSRVGPYRITEMIGVGGMGSVYRGERDDGTYEQTVAIKFVRRALGNKAGSRLLERERTQLARLEHSNIARIIDGGISEFGELYYVMEYIDGVRITDYALDLDQESILNLALQLCAAVAYCHRALVVHGDIKPQNILVANDRVRLMDFGIGRILTEGEGVDKPVYAFSPHYASPEQASGGPPTIPSDIYSLGVVLGQLLTRERAKAFATESLEITLTRAQLPADLVGIIRRCLTVDPDNRYATVDALSDDIRAFLEHRPVEAVRQTRRYLAAKFVRRNRLLVASVTLVVTALALGLGVSLWQYRTAQAEAFRAGEVNAFLQGLFRDVSPWVSRSEGPVTLLQVMDSAAERIPEELKDTPEVQHEIMQIISYGYSGLQEYDKAFELQRKSLDYWLATRDKPDFAIATAQTAIARQYLDRGEAELAAELVRDSIGQLEAMGLDETLDMRTALIRLSTITRKIAPEESAAAARRHHEVVMATMADDSFEVARSYAILAEGSITLGNYEEAVLQTRAALEHAGPDAETLLPSMIGIQCQLGSALAFNGQWAEAYENQTRCLDLRLRRFGADSPQMVSTRSNLALIAMTNGKLEEAIEQAEQAKQLAVEKMPLLNSSRLGAEANRAMLDWQAGDAAAAEPALRSVLDRQVESVGADNPNVLRVGSMLGRVLLELGRVDEAAQYIVVMPANLPTYWQEDARLWAAELAIAQGDRQRAIDLAGASAVNRRDSGKFMPWQVAEAEWVLGLAEENAELRTAAAEQLRALLPDNHLRRIQSTDAL